MIEWATKGVCKASQDGANDVRINIISENRLAITFYFNCFAKIAATDYIIFGLDEDAGRLYFKGATKDNGYKRLLNKNKTISTVHKSLSPEDIGKYKEVVGQYKLEYDKDNKLNFITYSKINWQKKGR